MDLQQSTNSSLLTHSHTSDSLIGVPLTHSSCDSLEQVYPSQGQNLQSPEVRFAETVQECQIMSNRTPKSRGKENCTPDKPRRRATFKSDLVRSYSASNFDYSGITPSHKAGKIPNEPVAII